jgi:hypothetical protein
MHLGELTLGLAEAFGHHRRAVAALLGQLRAKPNDRLRARLDQQFQLEDSGAEGTLGIGI